MTIMITRIIYSEEGENQLVFSTTVEVFNARLRSVTGRIICCFAFFVSVNSFFYLCDLYAIIVRSETPGRHVRAMVPCSV